MIIKVAGGYLDFNGQIETERKAKAFEEIDSVDGDFSYSFDVGLTARNMELLGNPRPDTVKSFTRINADILNDSGILIYSGFLRVERITNVIECSFFSGNSDWFSQLSGKLNQIVSTSTINYNPAVIATSWNNTSGWFFPFADYGTWTNRQDGSNYITEDFWPWYYVKDIVNKVLSDSTIKLEGDLLNDWRYNHLIITSGVKQDTRIQERQASAKFEGTQTCADGVVQKITCSQLVSSGSLNKYNTTTGLYSVDTKMYLRVKYIVEVDTFFDNVIRAGITLNGSGIDDFGVTYSYLINSSADAGLTLSKEVDILVDAGDDIYLSVKNEDLGTGGSIEVLKAEVTFEPVFLYSFKLTEVLPDIEKVDFLVNIFKMFNCVISYEPSNQTITANLFDKIKTKTPIDLSEYLDSVEYDYVDFIQNYGQKTRLLYDDGGLNETYSNINEVPYGGGQIEVNNGYIEQEVDGVEIEFIPPEYGLVSALKGNFMKLGLVELVNAPTVNKISVTSITDSSGQARVNLDNFVQGLEVGSIIRLDVSDAQYNGDWLVETVGSVWVECYGLGFNGTATGDFNLLKPSFDNSNDIYVALAAPDLDGTDVSEIDIGGGNNIGYAYFNLLRTSRNVDQFRKSLSFGPVNQEGDYQQKMIEDYYGLFSKVLNDPTKLICRMLLPESIFKKITFQEPVTLKSIDSSNSYFVNRTSGYVSSSDPCFVELIKI